MPKIICKNCKKRYDSDLHMLCPKCGTPNYKSSDTYLDAHRSDMHEMLDTHDQYTAGTAYEADDYSKKFHQKIKEQNHTTTSSSHPNSNSNPNKSATELISKFILIGLRAIIAVELISILPGLVMALISIMSYENTPIPEAITYIEHTMDESIEIQDTTINIVSCNKVEADWINEITPIGYQLIAVGFTSKREDYAFYSDSNIYVSNDNSNVYYAPFSTYEIDDSLELLGLEATSEYAFYSGTYYDYFADTPVPNVNHLMFVVDDSWTSIDFYFEEHTGKDDNAILQSIHSISLPIAVIDEEVQP